MMKIIVKWRCDEDHSVKCQHDEGHRVMSRCDEEDHSVKCRHDEDHSEVEV